MTGIATQALQPRMMVWQRKCSSCDKRGGAASATEHAVPESMFPNTTLAAHDPAKPQGISAVKALAIAISQGQKTYTFNQSNQALHSTILQSLQISADVKLEIVNALAAGKEVTVHEKDISVNGWKGNGYVVLDPATGAGAYKIAGGTNGGVFEGLKYIIKTLNYFYDSLASLAAFMKTPVPLLETVVRFIQIAKLAHDILDKGLKCNNVGAIIIFLATSTIVSILMVELVMMIANPLAALAVGFTLDLAFDWLLDQSPQCAKG